MIKPWMLASLLAAVPGFCQQCAPCCPEPKPEPQCRKPVKYEKVCPLVCEATLIPAYNQSAMIDTRCPWDLWVEGSYTYWQAIQDNMEVAITDSETSSQISAGTIVDGHVVNTDFKYRNGFKAGLGVKSDHDDWDVYAEYTWFRSSTHIFSGSPPDAGSGIGVIIPTVGMPSVIDTDLYTIVSSRWTCNMDLVDAVMGRWYYVGTKLTFHPFAGARGAWIRQKFNTTYTVADLLLAAAQSTTYGDNDTSQQRTASWAVGPKMGLDINWMLGKGCRFYGSGSGDILFTRYTKLSFKELHTTSGTTTTNHISQHNLNTIRTHLDFEMGIGWGTYLDCRNWYLDLAAGYGFQVFFNQNMFRNFEDSSMRGKSLAPNGNLYIHGLTATMTLHF